MSSSGMAAELRRPKGVGAGAGRWWGPRATTTVPVVAALTPVPYMVFSWVAGFAEIAVWQCLLASVIFRSMRFFAVAAIVYVFGPAAKRFIDRYFNLATVLVMLLVIGVVVLVKVLRG